MRSISDKVLRDENALMKTRVLSMQEWDVLASDENRASNWFAEIHSNMNTTTAHRQGMAARYAAKLAIVDALPGYPEIHLLEIKNTLSGQPYLAHTAEAAKWLESIDVQDILVSLSHTKTFAAAVVVVHFKSVAHEF